MIYSGNRHGHILVLLYMSNITYVIIDDKKKSNKGSQLSLNIAKNKK